MNNKQLNAKAPAAVTEIYHHMAKAISAFEQSPVFNKFNSKFDYVLAGKTEFTPIEQEVLSFLMAKAIVPPAMSAKRQAIKTATSFRRCLRILPTIISACRVM